MAGVRYTIQKDVFDADDDRVLCVCTVSEVYKKKKANSYLVLVVNSKTVRSQVRLVQVKQYAGVYKAKRSWLLDEVKAVDGKVDGGHEFDILFAADKQDRWFAPNMHEKQNLISLLWKQMRKMGVDVTGVFQNIPQLWLDEAASPESRLDDRLPEQDTTSHTDDEGGDDFNALTEHEESQLNRLMGESEFAISDAEKFIEQLGKSLVELDGANVQSVLTSEKQVNALLEHLDSAIGEAERIEQRLDGYDEILCHIRDTMEKMGEKNSMIEIANTNNHELLRGLELIVQQLDLPYNYQKALTEPDLTTPVGLNAAVAAANALQQCLESAEAIDQNLLRLAAVQEQRKRMDKWKMKFSQTTSRHLNNMFIHLGNDLGGGGGANSGGMNEETRLILPKHTIVHQKLAPFAELMHWLKAMDRKAYDQLAKIYTNSLSKIYDREIKQFFDIARNQIRLDDLNASADSTTTTPKGKQATVPYGMIGVNKDLWPPGVETAERAKLDSLLEKVLGDLEPVALAEQVFCISFFQMETGNRTPNTPDGLAGGEGRVGGTAIISPSSVDLPQKRLDKQINDEVRKMMTTLFGCLEPELTFFIQSFEKMDSL